MSNFEEIINAKEIAAANFISILKKYNLRLPNEHEVKWFLNAESKVTNWIAMILNNQESIRILWQNCFLSICPLNKMQICDIFRPKRSGVFLLRPIPICEGMAVTVVLEYELPPNESSNGNPRSFRELREFFISPQEIEQEKLLELIRKKQWLLVPLKYDIFTNTYCDSIKELSIGNQIINNNDILIETIRTQIQDLNLISDNSPNEVQNNNNDSKNIMEKMINEFPK